MFGILMVILVSSGILYIVTLNNKTKKNECKQCCKNCKYHITNCCYSQKKSKITNDFCIMIHDNVIADEDVCEFYEE